MGSHITLAAAQAGVLVSVVDTSPEKLSSCRRGIERCLARAGAAKDAGAVKSYVDVTTSRITFTSDGAMAAGRADMVVEATCGGLKGKQQLLAQLDRLAPKEAIFCTTTRSLHVTDLAPAAITRSGRVFGLHFPLFAGTTASAVSEELVEVVQTGRVDAAAVEEVLCFTRRMRAVPVVCRRDGPGFILQRLLVPYLLEASRLVERGVAPGEDVDIAMKLGCGYPMGPFELCEKIGHDRLSAVVKELHDADPQNPIFTPSKGMDIFRGPVAEAGEAESGPSEANASKENKAVPRDSPEA